jgi:Na+/H+-translocating membrane pyrophosphatase
VGTVLVGALTAGLGAPVVYPFLLGGVAILASVVGILFVNTSNAKPASALMGGVVVSSLISAVVFWGGLVWMIVAMRSASSGGVPPSPVVTMVAILTMFTGLVWYAVTKLRVWWHHK